MTFLLRLFLFVALSREEDSVGGNRQIPSIESPSIIEQGSHANEIECIQWPDYSAERRSRRNRSVTHMRSRLPRLTREDHARR